jgi:hypothetical protein
MNQPIPENTLALIKEALFRGEKIRAIKLHREATGSGLAEAKNEVEKLQASLRASSPEKFTAASSGKGCLTIIVIVIVCAIAGAVLLWVRK